MKKHLMVFAGFILLNLAVMAQGSVNLVIFSEDGDPFYTYINGVKQNNAAQTHAKFTSITPDISLRIEFENTALAPIKQTMALEPGFEHTARIKRDMKNQLKLRYFGSVLLADAVNTTEYHTAEDPGTLITIGSPSTTVINPPARRRRYSSNQTQHTDHNRNPNSYSRTNRCPAPISPASFNKMKESIESKPFSNTKMSTARVATQNNCLSVSQIKAIATLFSMDDDRLAYAKFAYDYCVDKGNYYQVSDVFKFSSTTEELNAFLTH